MTFPAALAFPDGLTEGLPDGAGAEVELADVPETGSVELLAGVDSSVSRAGVSTAGLESVTSLVNRQMQGCIGH